MAQRLLALLRTATVLSLAAVSAFVAGCAGDSANRPASSLQIHMARVQKTPGHIRMRVPGEPDAIYVFPDAAITGLDIKDVQVTEVKRAGAPAIGGIMGNTKGRQWQKGRPAPTFSFGVAITFTRAGAKRLARAMKETEGQGVIGAVPIERDDEELFAWKEKRRHQMKGQGPAAEEAERLAWKRKSLGKMKADGLIAGDRDLQPLPTAKPQGGTTRMPGFAVGRLAFIVGGRLVIAPPFKGEVGRKMLISSDFSQQEANRLAAILRGNMGPAPAGAVQPALQAEPEEPETTRWKQQRPSGGTPYRRPRKRRRRYPSR